MHSHPSTAALARSLLTPEAVRARAGALFALAEAGRLAHWSVNRDRLEMCADFVADVTRTSYPPHAVPLHARWRNFAVGGIDRWRELLLSRAWAGADAIARAGFDLAIISVLLDAGAGAAWRWVEPDTGRFYARSEGLALASLAMFRAGLFSARPSEPLRVDVEALEALPVEALAAGFQAGPDNPLVGMEGRRELVAGLAAALRARPDLFGTGDGLRPAGLYDRLKARAAGGAVMARDILVLLLEGLGAVWPGRETLGGIPLGDCWRHPAVKAQDASSGLVPFHKLSHWMAYSLIEPLQSGGVRVVDLNGLPGLAEYRNGGLFVDAGVVALRDPQAALRLHTPGSELVVEWRALTIALLDLLAPLVRERLGLGAPEMPLARILEGGTWAAGRRLARRARPDASPPILVESDGTVF